MIGYTIATGLLVIAITSIAWTMFRGAPWVPTSVRTVLKMLKMAETGPDDVVYDLGCGDGRIILAAVRRFDSRAVGIEIDPLRYIWSLLIITLLGHRDRIQVVYGDFFSKDLSQADVVTCYLLQSTNEKLESKLLRELKPGARVVSYTFTFPKMKLVVEDTKEEIYCYEIEG
jgi:cyclopropane fatty-acyl-phospholipid synthase-like methyltransferase